VFSDCAKRIRFSLSLVGATLVAGLGLVSGVCAADATSKNDPAKVEFFEKKIRPMLIENCINCHSAENGGKGGLRVDDRNGLIEGGGRGAAIVPGKPDASLLIKAVKHVGGLQMPPKKQLTDEQITDLEKWILDGAAWPAVKVPEDLTKPKPEYEELRKNHWAWQAVRDQNPPEVSDPALIRQ
jgi:mono/diheme cytochrome c family protein